MTAIRIFRLKQQMTQRDLAEALGVSPAAVTQYETGARKPDIVKLKKIAEVLHCTTDELLESIDTQES